jgi:hypothetical protein
MIDLATHEKIVALAQSGIYVSEISRQAGASHSVVRTVLLKNGIVPPRCALAPKRMERDEQMVSMYRQCVSLEKIGQHFGVTRERVRQIMVKYGVTAKDGGQQRRAVGTLTGFPRSLAKWGIPYAEKKARRQDGTIPAFVSQRNAAGGRGIVWSLTFVQWLEVWTVSGKLAQRGRGKGHYVMSRIKDEGGYVVGNVHIQLSTDNNRQGLAKCRDNKARNTGVWLMFPGSSRPWYAAYGKTKVGRYATEEEAAAARAAYVEANELRLRIRGRGYSVIRGKTDRYQVMFGRKYIGTFGTPEDALAARAVACQNALQPAQSGI